MLLNLRQEKSQGSNLALANLLNASFITYVCNCVMGITPDGHLLCSEHLLCSAYDNGIDGQIYAHGGQQ